MRKQLYFFLITGLTFISTNVFGQIPASKITLVNPAGSETTSAIMDRQSRTPFRMRPLYEEREGPNRRHLRQNPLAISTSRYPVPDPGFTEPPVTDLAQTPSTSFNGVTGPDETGAYPPDDMGAIGPTQYIVFVNGRLRSFNKTTGVADGVLNADPDVFFSSVMTPVGGSVLQVFTSDPRIRYDRLSARWLLIIIDVPCTNAGCSTTAANRCLIAVSNSSTITGLTTWTFSQFTGQASRLLDYPTLGLDNNALYIGGNMFSLAGVFQGTNGYVINRSDVMSGAAYAVYTFAGLATGAGSGPYTPQGVVNFDIASTEGYFIGVDNATYSLLQIRRVSTPGGVPTISANIPLTVPTTGQVLDVPNLGGALSLDAIDDRLYAAVMRNGSLWTAHAISVNASGVASTTQGRQGCRWYEINSMTTTPALVQSGTIFDNAATAAAARWHWFPTVMVSGQGHAAFSMTTAGSTFRANAMTTGRLSGDALGSTQANTLTTASSTAYSVGNDRWGDYSYVSLDPLDDMTMWMINQYCVATNKYGCNVTKLLAPPPATPTTCSPATVAAGQASVNITLTGTAISGSGFYDPGANLPAPALAFNHIAGSISGSVTVNSVTYTDPTHVTLNISTVGTPAGLKNVTITNPDGQSLSGTGILTVTAVATVSDLSITKTDGATTYTPGSTTTYTIVASNGGTDPVTGATVADVFPAAFTSVNWTAAYAGGASGPASGLGNINASVNIPVGGTATFTAVCNISAAATGSLSNTATITAPVGTTDPTPGNNSATDTDTANPLADLSITKTDGVTTYVPGGSRTYTIIVGNNGPSNVTGATVTDNFPAAITSASWTAAYAGGATGPAAGAGNISVTVNIPVGGTVTFTVVCNISAAATGSLSNTATVSSGVTDPTPGNNSATDTDTANPSADLSITKTDGVTTVTPGGTTTYTIVVSNNGPSNVTGATVTDNFPAAITSASWTAVYAGGATGPGSGSGNISASVNIPVGGTITFTVVCNISPAATGSLSNTASVSSGITDPTPGNNFATDTDTATPSADLSITKTDGVTTVTPGGTTTYTIIVSNNGLSNVPSATVTDNFPAAITSASWTAVYAGGATGPGSGSGNISASVNIPVGGTITFTVVCNISAFATGSLSNTASVSSGVTDPNPGNNFATDTDTETPSADLSITKTDGVTIVTPGGTTTYTIIVSNNGLSNVTGATVTDNFPAAITSISWTAAYAGGATGPGSGSGDISASVNIPPGGSVTFTAVCNISGAASGSLSNTATVSSGVTDPNPGNNSATDTDTVSPNADLSITKTDGVTTVTPGTTTTYTIVVTNNGPVNVTGATVTDNFPAAITSANWTAAYAGGATGPGSGSGNISATVNIPVGGSVTFTVVCNISAAATGSLSNTATVSSGVADPNPANNSATDTDTANPMADQSITKTDGVTTYSPGGTTTYTIVVVNNGPSNASSVTMIDNFPAAITSANWTAAYAGGATGPGSGSGNMNVTMNIPVSGSVTFTVVCNISGAASGNLVNNATVSSTTTDPNPANNSAADTDTPAPCILTCPANITTSNDLNQCGAVVNYPAPTITGSCGTVTATPSSGSFFGIGTTTVTVTSSFGPTCTFTITVNDTQGPNITCPGAANVSCAAAVPAPNIGSVTATDNCPGIVVVTHRGDVISAQTCANRYTITRTYRATDVANNFSECTQIITVNDQTPPTLTCPGPATVSCASAVPAPNIASVTGVSDNCAGVVTVTHQGDVISALTCTNRYTITRTYRATDVCGNFAECTQIITVNDQTPPTLTCPGPVTVSCASAVPAPNIASVTGVSDNCAGVVTITHQGDVISAQTCANRYTITRTYRATDVCGNFAECTQIITVNDQTAPTLTCPGPVTVSCASAVPAPNIASVTGVSDNCTGVVTITHQGDVISAQTCANRYTITRTYRATDVCGNFAECTQIITVNDQTPPTLTCPGPVTVSCANAVPAPNIASVTGVSDNCGGVVTITHQGDVISAQTCANRYTITRTYRATDVCGNFAQCTQIITVNDQTAPVITCPANISVSTSVGSCVAIVNFTVTATDNCAGAVTIVNVPASGTAFPIGTTTVNSTATDVCGNSSTCSFTVTVTDAQLPVITIQPVNRTVCVGATASFSVTAVTSPSAGGPLSYQWQGWNGSAWVDISGATASTLTLTSVTVSMNTNSYRVRVVGLCTTIFSTPATLYVNPLPSVVIVASIPPILLPGQTLTLTAVVSPPGGSFVWKKNGVVIVGATGAALTGLTVNDIGIYQVTYTDPNGCVAVSTTLTISGLPSTNLYVYPNPNLGTFQIRFYNQANEPVTVNVFDSKGAMVYQKKFTTTTTYSSIEVNLGNLPQGSYLVQLLNSSDVVIGAKWIIVYH